MKNQHKLICFDVDDTLTEGIIWSRLSSGIGWSWEEHRNLYKERLAGLRTFKENRAYILQKYIETGNANEKTMNAILSKTKLKPFAKELFQILNKNGFVTHLLSGGFKTHVAHVAELLNTTGYSAASDLAFGVNGQLEKIIAVESQKHWKVEELRRIAELYDVPVEMVYIVGDGENDVEIFKLSNYGIAVHTTDPKLLVHSWKEAKSLEEIPGILGIE